MTYDHVMQWVHWICTILVVFGIPSIINGFLSHRPPEEQLIGGKILEAVSALARRDSPQTFKLPGTPSKPPCEPLAIDCSIEKTDGDK